MGQGVQAHWSSLLTPRAVPCCWFTVRDGKSGRVYVLGQQAATVDCC